MRTWLILLVALVNGVAWWWLDGQRALRLTAPPAQTPITADSRIPKLLLLREVEPEPSLSETVQPDAPQPEVPQPEVPQPEVPQLEASPPAEAPVVAVIDTEPLPPVEPLVQDATAVATRAAETDVGASAPSGPDAAAAPQPELVPSAQPGPERAPVPAPPAANATPAIADAVDCLILGTTTSRAQLMAWRDRLLAGKIAVGENVEATTEVRPSSYRVSLPAGAAPSEKIAKLRAADIEVLLVVGDDAIPRISAGVFKVRANALQQQQRLIDLGYSAQVAPVERPVSQFWLTISGPAGLKDRAAALLGGAEPRWRACPAGTGVTAGGQH